MYFGVNLDGAVIAPVTAELQVVQGDIVIDWFDTNGMSIIRALVVNKLGVAHWSGRTSRSVGAMLALASAEQKRDCSLKIELRSVLMAARGARGVQIKGVAVALEIGEVATAELPAEDARNVARH